MAERLTEEDAEKLADIIWWVRGYNAAAIAVLGGQIDLDASHLEVLRRVRLYIHDNLPKETA